MSKEGQIGETEFNKWTEAKTSENLFSAYTSEMFTKMKNELFQANEETLSVEK